MVGVNKDETETKISERKITERAVIRSPDARHPQQYVSGFISLFRLYFDRVDSIVPMIIQTYFTKTTDSWVNASRVFPLMIIGRIRLRWYFNKKKTFSSGIYKFIVLKLRIGIIR